MQARERNYFVTPGLVVNSNESEPRGHFIIVKVRICMAAPELVVNSNVSCTLRRSRAGERARRCVFDVKTQSFCLGQIAMFSLPRGAAAYGNRV